MAQQRRDISEALITFIEAQQVFFVGTAPQEGRINVSPKGTDSLKVVSPTRVVWLNLTGSGNETAAHIAENGRMTIMFCSFTEKALILRLYGQARAVHPRDAEWQALSSLFAPVIGARQVIDMEVDLVHTSCGWGVPICEYVSERQKLQEWADGKGAEGIKRYWLEKNSLSIDGIPTGIED
ncbi:MAG: pyridoxamine 5'-phosphate oxidase family protein [Planctomycetes bacterium]|nr:pyridoxamine 5'-phosphate oxidase family protein [Planctomycetota bacterium]